ncbi:hypothetical protein D3C71_1478170 [compost metagenome]
MFPFVGPETGVVLAVKAVPSGSESPASVKSPVAVPSSGIVWFSLSTIGGSFTGPTVMKMVSFTHSAGSGVPSSQICTIMVSGPLYPLFGV